MNLLLDLIQQEVIIQVSKHQEGRGFYSHIVLVKKPSEVSTDTELENSEQINLLQTLSDGHDVFNNETVVPKMLYGISGPNGCLSAHSESPRLPTVSPVSTQPEEFITASPVQSSAIRTIVLPQDLYKSDGGSTGASEAKEDISRPISR